MYRIPLAIIACLTLGSCASNETSFESMSFEELAIYNSTAELADTVYCIEGVRTGSHIRKNRCATLLEIANSLENSSTELGTINYGGRGTLGGFAQFPSASN